MHLCSAICIRMSSLMSSCVASRIWYLVPSAVSIVLIRLSQPPNTNVDAVIARAQCTNDSGTTPRPPHRTQTFSAPVIAVRLVRPRQSRASGRMGTAGSPDARGPRARPSVDRYAVILVLEPSPVKLRIFPGFAGQSPGKYVVSPIPGSAPSHIACGACRRHISPSPSKGVGCPLPGMGRDHDLCPWSHWALAQLIPIF